MGNVNLHGILSVYKLAEWNMHEPE